MNYANIKYNDIANGEGISVSLFVSGCPHHCTGCFNPETWDYGYGKPFAKETEKEILDAIAKNDIIRNFNILGGEPLAPANCAFVLSIVKKVRKYYPNIIIRIWTGYLFEELPEKLIENLKKLKVNMIIDGPFIESQKSYEIAMRGSKNQRIYELINGEYIDNTKKYDNMII